MSQGTRRRNAALKKHFRPPAAVTSETPPPIKLWPASNPDHATIWWGVRIEKPLFVYFIQDANGPVKIGKAHDPRARLADLQCGNPQPLQLRAVVLAAVDTEDRLHRSWNHCRISGEWFAADSASHILELAKRTQRGQIEAFKRGKSPFDITRMAADSIAPSVNVRANKLVVL